MRTEDWNGFPNSFSRVHAYMRINKETRKHPAHPAYPTRKIFYFQCGMNGIGGIKNGLTSITRIHARTVLFFITALLFFITTLLFCNDTIIFSIDSTSFPTHGGSMKENLQRVQYCIKNNLHYLCTVRMKVLAIRVSFPRGASLYRHYPLKSCVGNSFLFYISFHKYCIIIRT